MVFLHRLVRRLLGKGKKQYHFSHLHKQLTRTSIHSTGVLFKLVAFSVSLGIVPIASYFASEKYIWNGASRAVSSTLSSPTCIPGNSTFAAITAVVAANVVLVAYIVSSLRDDKAEREAARPKESRKESRKDR